LDVRQAAGIIEEQFPELLPARVTYLGEGCDSVAFDVSSRWVFRFPKRRDVEQQLLLEFRVLPVIAAGSPLPIPEFCFHGRPSAAFPRHFGGYPKLLGEPANHVEPAEISIAQWAPALARFLSWLHTFSVEKASELGVERSDIAAVIAESRTEALNDFDLLRAVAPDAPLDDWHAFLQAELHMSSPPSSNWVLTHADLAAEHVLYAPATEQISGVIDWSDMAISDPSLDLAGIFHWGGESFLNAVLDAYAGPIDEGIRQRARFLAACRGVGDVKFGIETRQRRYVDAGLRALEHSCRK
jgi:aminoglycoside phosphotransferase (APT) family kinase protein